eukprot:GFUD01066943.1.p1 GENE.GFUD01066943.1~~GFUD01066943.1.p1  ORF type:complete len:194 (+),score=29.91 GFUD01066943.1:57-584(+)
MAAKNLPKCLHIDCGIPTDVRFLFKDDSEEIKEVKAHKLLLAAASDVFQRWFYGSMKEDKEEDVEIVDSRQEVFKTMVEYIYNKELDWNAFDLHFHSSLYYQAEKYNIGDLKAEILSSIERQSRHIVNLNNVLEAASLAGKTLFEPLSNLLYKISVTCLAQCRIRGAIKSFGLKK